MEIYSIVPRCLEKWLQNGPNAIALVPRGIVTLTCECEILRRDAPRNDRFNKNMLTKMGTTSLSVDCYFAVIIQRVFDQFKFDLEIDLGDTGFLQFHRRIAQY